MPPPVNPVKYGLAIMYEEMINKKMVTKKSRLYFKMFSKYSFLCSLSAKNCCIIIEYHKIKKKTSKNLITLKK